VNLHMVVLNEMMTSVIPSQVVAPARAYARAFPGIRVRIWFLEPARTAFSRRARRALRRLREGWPDGDLTLVPYVGRMGRWSPAFSLRAALAWRGERSVPAVFHCRGAAASLQAWWVARRRASKVVFDCRGATDVEAALRLHDQGRATPERLERAARAERDLQDLALSVADAVLAVSEPLASRLRCTASSSRAEVRVVPACVERLLYSEEARAHQRAELGLRDEELLLVHTSSEGRWEAFDQVVAFFDAVRHRRPARLLFLTTLDRELLAQRAGGRLPDGSLVRRSAPDSVGELLSAADVGLLLRRPHETHRFASPIKFTEYLAAGLPSVVSEGIGATADIVSAHRVGIVLSGVPTPLDFDDAAARLDDLFLGGAEDVRRRALLTCEEHFFWTRHVATVGRAYGLVA
jgi:glycosyltransferase involved in cell wall biosynthesis